MASATVWLVLAILVGAVHRGAAAQLAPAGVTGATLRLAVDDSASGQPVVGARIELVSRATVRQSDDLGRVVFTDVSLGYQRVRISAIGFRPINRIFAVAVVAASDSSATLIDLIPIAQLLDTVTSSATRSVSRTAKLDDGGFDMRRKMGIGHFLDTDLIDREAWRSSLGDMIAEHVVGMRDCGNVCSVQARTQGFLGGARRGACMLDVYVDGIHQSDKFKIDEIDPGEIAAIEVYTMVEAPVQFKAPAGGRSSGAAECGVLLLWRRM